MNSLAVLEDGGIIGKSFKNSRLRMTSLYMAWFLLANVAHFVPYGCAGMYFQCYMISIHAAESCSSETLLTR